MNLTIFSFFLYLLIVIDTASVLAQNASSFPVNKIQEKQTIFVIPRDANEAISPWILLSDNKYVRYTQQKILEVFKQSDFEACAITDSEIVAALSDGKEIPWGTGDELTLARKKGCDLYMVFQGQTINEGFCSEEYTVKLELYDTETGKNLYSDFIYSRGRVCQTMDPIDKAVEQFLEIVENHFIVHSQ